jgi:peptidoglycan-associated lipoprotein
MKPQVIGSSALIAIVALLAGCHKQVAVVHPPAPPPPIANARSTPPPAPQPAAHSVEPVASNTPDSATKLQIQTLLDRIQDVYFNYDQHNIRPDAQKTLAADAESLRQILQQYPNYKLTVEGFCDERGSDAYNLALGDSRALNAKEFLETLGLPAAQLRVVSFGKERPVCTEHTESCWQKNRRAHITQDQNVG